jgi:hypothetical protein
VTLNTQLSFSAEVKERKRVIPVLLVCPFMSGYRVNFNFNFTFGMLSGVKTSVK